MYLQFFGLREAPFNPTPDPKFLFQSSRHREALAQLLYGVRERKGFIVLTGEIGTGKTTLLRTLLEKLDQNTSVAYVHNTALSIEGRARPIGLRHQPAPVRDQAARQPTKLTDATGTRAQSGRSAAGHPREHRSSPHAGLLQRPISSSASSSAPRLP